MSLATTLTCKISEVINWYNSENAQQPISNITTPEGLNQTRNNGTATASQHHDPPAQLSCAQTPKTPCIRPQTLESLSRFFLRNLKLKPANPPILKNFSRPVKSNSFTHTINAPKIFFPKCLKDGHDFCLYGHPNPCGHNLSL